MPKKGLPAPMWESMGEQTGPGFPLPTLRFWGPQVRFASGINLRVCIDKGQDLFSTDTCPSVEQA